MEDLDIFDDEILNVPTSNISFCIEPESCRFRYRSERKGDCKALCELRGINNDIPKVEMFLPTEACKITLKVSLITEDEEPHFLDLYHAGVRRGNVPIEFKENSCIIHYDKSSSPRAECAIPFDLPCLGIGFIAKNELPKNIDKNFYKKNKDSCKLKVDAFINDNYFDSTVSTVIKNELKLNVATYLYSEGSLLIVMQNKITNFDHVDVMCLDTSTGQYVESHIANRYHQAVLDVRFRDHVIASQLKVTVFKKKELSCIDEIYIDIPDSPMTVRKRKRDVGPSLSETNNSDQKAILREKLKQRITEKDLNQQVSQVSTTSDQASTSSPSSSAANKFDVDQFLNNSPSSSTLQTDSAAPSKLETDCATAVKPEPVEYRPVSITASDNMKSKKIDSSAKSTTQTSNDKEALHKELISKVRNKSMGLVYRLPHQLAFGISETVIIDEFITQIPFLLTVCDQQGDTPLHNAFLKEQEGAAMRLLKAVITKCPKYLNKENKAGHTPLILLPHVKTFETSGIARIMLENGANLEAKDCYKNTVIHYAVRKEQTALLEVLLIYVKKQGKFSVIDEINFSHQAALHYAVLVNNEPILRQLLSISQINRNVKNNKSHETPLHLAVLFGRLELVKILLGDSEVDVHARDKSGRTALRIANQNNHIDIAKMLEERGVVDDGPTSDEEDSDNFDLMDDDDDSSSLDEDEFEMIDHDDDQRVESSTRKLEHDAPVIADSSHSLTSMTPTSPNFNQASIDCIEPSRQMNRLSIHPDDSMIDQLINKLQGMPDRNVMKAADLLGLSEDNKTIIDANRPSLPVFRPLVKQHIRNSPNQQLEIEKLRDIIQNFEFTEYPMDTTG